MLGDLLAVERDEAALVWTAQSQGMPVEHRADISPLALLGLNAGERQDAGEYDASSVLSRTFDPCRVPLNRLRFRDRLQSLFGIIKGEIALARAGWCFRHTLTLRRRMK